MPVYTNEEQIMRIMRPVRTIPDAVSEAFKTYRAAGGEMQFPEWHRRADDVPPHNQCNFCHD